MIIDSTDVQLDINYLLLSRENKEGRSRLEDKVQTGLNFIHLQGLHRVIFSGVLPEEHVKEEFPLWYEEIKEEEGE